MHEKTEPFDALGDSLAEGIAAVIAADENLSATEDDLADLFLEELNRLWLEPMADAA